MHSFPVFLHVRDKSIVIFGGGEQAAQKARLVLKTDALLTIIAPNLCDELAALVTGGRVDHIEATLEIEPIRKAQLVFVATGCKGADAAIAAIARNLGVLINAVDQPDLCDVTTPAIVDRDPVVVAIGTEGTAPVLARQIKTKVEEMLEPSLGRFARIAGELRSRVAQQIAPSRHRGFWEWAFHAPRRLFAKGSEDKALALLERALSAGGAPRRQAGMVSIVGAGPGAVDMMTLRGVQRLQTADVIFYDRFVDPAVLELARRDAQRVFLGKTLDGIEWQQSQVNKALALAAKEGHHVVRLRSGDPALFDCGLGETHALDSTKTEWEVVPGVTTAAAAAADAKFAQTGADSPQPVLLTPGQSAERRSAEDWSAYARPGTIVALAITADTAGQIQSDLLGAGVPTTAKLKIVQNASREDTHVISTTLGKLSGAVGRELTADSAILLFRRPIGVAASTVIPLSKKRRSDSDNRSAKGDSGFKIATHPH